MITDQLIEWAERQSCPIIHIEHLQDKLRELKFPPEIKSYFRDQRISRWYVEDIKIELNKFRHLL